MGWRRRSIWINVNTGYIQTELMTRCLGRKHKNLVPFWKISNSYISVFRWIDIGIEYFLEKVLNFDIFWGDNKPWVPFEYNLWRTCSFFCHRLCYLAMNSDTSWNGHTASYCTCSTLSQKKFNVTQVLNNHLTISKSEMQPWGVRR